MRHAILFTVTVAMVLLGSCNGDTPTSPITAAPSLQVALAVGRWSAEGNGACLSVAQAESSLIAGCWRGRFATPSPRADGTFDVDGTFRFEGGPSNDSPGAPAHFSGRLDGTTLTLTVQQTAPSAPSTPTAFTLTFAGEGSCSPLCV